MRKYWSHCDPSRLLGLLFTSVERTSDAVLFGNGANAFSLHHDDDCCESVELEDIAGDLGDLVGSPILQCEIITNSDDPPQRDYTPESYTRTFIKIATIKGGVTIRFFGESNGYYGETADFHEQLERSY